MKFLIVTQHGYDRDIVGIVDASTGQDVLNEIAEFSKPYMEALAYRERMFMTFGSEHPEYKTAADKYLNLWATPSSFRNKKLHPNYFCDADNVEIIPFHHWLADNTLSD